MKIVPRRLAVLRRQWAFLFVLKYNSVIETWFCANPIKGHSVIALVHSWS